MDKERLQQLIDLVSRSVIYKTPACEEGIRIDYEDTLEDLDEDFDFAEDELPLQFYGTGEETGNGYEIYYTEIDLTTDQFFELKLVDTSAL